MQSRTAYDICSVDNQRQCLSIAIDIMPKKIDKHYSFHTQKISSH